MKIQPRSFPYPVLSKFSDDITPNGFEVDLNVIPSISHFKLEYSVRFDSLSFHELIDQEKATLVIHIECQSNFYRKIFRNNKLAGIISIPTPELTGRVEVTFMVVANQDLPEYKIKGFHEDYKEFDFHIKRAELLALLETKYFEAEKEPNLLQKISSIIQIIPFDDDQKHWEIEFDAKKIYIRMSKNDMQKYHLLKDNTSISQTLSSSVVIPALMEALQIIKNTNTENLESERDNRWFSVIERKLGVLNIDLKNTKLSTFAVAQQIMEFPSESVFEELCQLTESGE